MTVPFSSDDVMKWTGGEATGHATPAVYRGVSINTQTLNAGDLFIAIRGERHDAHRFIPMALDAGAAGLVIERAWLRENRLVADVPLISVENSTAALGALAAGHRQSFQGAVVAITGSNGKTTTKELCHGILSLAAPCLKTHGNLNNEFGLPLTLLQREIEHQAVVVELGMNHRGEIARLAAIAKPDVGVITNVGTAHIEYLGSREEIALEKGDLAAAIGPEGKVVLNLDDEYVAGQARRVAGEVVTFGRSPSADVTAEDVRFDSSGSFGFRLKTPSGDTSIVVRGIAETTVINSLAAATAAQAAGASLDQIAQGLGRHEQVPGRMACQALSNGCFVIDDTYNANPQSMRSALESLARMKGEASGIAVLADMGELGETADAAHWKVGEWVAELGTNALFTVGERAEAIAAGARATGMNPDFVHEHREHEEVGRLVQEMLSPGDWVLVKGSRAMKMERVVDTLAREESR